MSSSCWLCSQGSIERPELYSDGTLKPCVVCLLVIQENLEALEAMGKKKKQTSIYQDLYGVVHVDSFDEDDLEFLDETEYLTELEIREFGTIEED